MLVVILGGAALALFGVIGRPDRGERFDAKQLLVSPAGTDGIRVRQVIDQDFGTTERHGFQLNVSNDYGEPQDIEASSADAPDDLQVDDVGGATRIRIGDPDATVSGQHRYLLEYTQPDAGISSGRLDFDVVYAGEELETRRFEVVVTGFELRQPTCRYGTEVEVNECQLVRDDGVWRAVVEPLEAGQGIQIGAGVTGTGEPADVAPPELPDRRQDRRGLVAAGMIPLGILTAAIVYVVTSRLGRNEVYAGGAADAAFTAFGDRSLPPPGMQTELVSDARLGDLATTEFVPPRAIQPWEGALLLGEQVDDDSVGAWFAGLAAQDIICLERAEGDGQVVMRSGPRRTEADMDTALLLRTAFADRSSVALGEYDERFANAWRGVSEAQQRRIERSGWWKRPPAARSSGGSSPLRWVVVGAVIWVIVGVGSLLTALLGLFRSVPGAVVFGIAAPALAAYLAYRSLLPARSALGSALTLRTESFRRFLDASEGRHVEWAWQHGLVRQYSAWAVALGTADAWQRALAASNVPPDEYRASGPLIVYSMGSSFFRTRSEPSTSGTAGSGFSGGGFSGGSVGGGGGGGGSSSGSW